MVKAVTVEQAMLHSLYPFLLYNQRHSSLMLAKSRT